MSPLCLRPLPKPRSSSCPMPGPSTHLQPLLQVISDVPHVGLISLAVLSHQLCGLGTQTQGPGDLLSGWDTTGHGVEGGRRPLRMCPRACVRCREQGQEEADGSPSMRRGPGGWSHPAHLGPREVNKRLQQWTGVLGEALAGTVVRDMRACVCTTVYAHALGGCSQGAHGGQSRWWAPQAEDSRVGNGQHRLGGR